MTQQNLSKAIRSALMASPVQSTSGGSLIRDCDRELSLEAYAKKEVAIDSEDDDVVCSPKENPTLVDAVVFQQFLDLHKATDFSKPLLQTFSLIDKQQKSVNSKMLELLKRVEAKYFGIGVTDDVKKALCHANLAKHAIRWTPATDGRCALSGVPATHMFAVEIDSVYTAIRWCTKNKKTDIILEKVDVVPEHVFFPIHQDQIKNACAICMLFSFASSWSAAYSEHDANGLARRFDSLFAFLKM